MKMSLIFSHVQMVKESLWLQHLLTSLTKAPPASLTLHFHVLHEALKDDLGIKLFSEMIRDLNQLFAAGSR